MKTTKEMFKVIGVLLLTIVLLSGCSETKNEKVSTDTKGQTASTNKGKKLNIVSSESKLEWMGKKVTGQHNGTVDLGKGDLYVDGGKLTGGSFEIDFSTIKVLDITDESLNAKLTGHLKSDDFFSVSTFSIGKFEITSVTAIPNATTNNYTIGGKLTIKGITKEISFPAKVNISGDAVTAMADFNIDRTLWDIKYNSGKYFENLGDKLISDEFNIKFNIIAKQI